MPHAMRHKLPGELVVVVVELIGLALDESQLDDAAEFFSKMELNRIGAGKK